MPTGVAPTTAQQMHVVTQTPPVVAPSVAPEVFRKKRSRSPECDENSAAKKAAAEFLLEHRELVVDRLSSILLDRLSDGVGDFDAAKDEPLSPVSVDESAVNDEMARPVKVEVDTSVLWDPEWGNRIVESGMDNRRVKSVLHLHLLFPGEVW